MASKNPCTRFWVIGCILRLGCIKGIYQGCIKGCIKGFIKGVLFFVLVLYLHPSLFLLTHHWSNWVKKYLTFTIHHGIFWCYLPNKARLGQKNAPKRALMGWLYHFNGQLLLREGAHLLRGETLIQIMIQVASKPVLLSTTLDECTVSSS